MKKLFLLFLLFFTTNSFASGIASNTASAPCTNTTLETYSGNSNLSADWQPNEIQLRWYNGNTLMDVQSAANTCTYDDTLTIPSTAPTRTGYTFDGWTVRPEYDFSTLPTNEIGTEAYGIGIDGRFICYTQTAGEAEGTACYTPVFIDGFNGLDKGEWKTVFSWGTLYGMSMCSSSAETPIESNDGRYCWCKATGYIPNGASTKYAPISANWVYNSNCWSDRWGSICSSVCAGRCALYTTDYMYKSLLLKGLLGVQ